MIDYIEELYGQVNIVDCISELVLLCRNDSRTIIRDNLSDISDSFYELLTTLDNLSCQDILNCRTKFENARRLLNCGDYSQAGDLLWEIKLDLYNNISLFGKIDVSDGEHRLLSSKSGFLTIQLLKTGKYIHSALEPMHEAYICAKEIYNPKHRRCVLFGCGLGYLALKIYELSNSSIDIYIFDSSPKMVQYAYDYGVLSWIDEDRIQVIVDEDGYSLFEKYSDLVSNLDEDLQTLYCYDYIINSMPTEISNILGEYNMLLLTKKQYINASIINFNKNLANCTSVWNEAESVNHCCVVAAGPSIDYSIDAIRSLSDSSTIICVGTIYDRLLNEGIVPDYVVELDPDNRTRRHFSDIINVKKMCIASTANWMIGSDCSGEILLIPISGIKEIEDYYALHNIEMWDEVGTVSTLAIDIALHLDAKTIELFGYDLSYPTGVSHAKGTMDYGDANSSNTLQIMGTDGSMVSTSKEFMHYLEEIKKRTLSNKDIKFINHSKHGALILGTINA